MVQDRTEGGEGVTGRRHRTWGGSRNATGGDRGNDTRKSFSIMQKWVGTGPKKTGRNGLEGQVGETSTKYRGVEGRRRSAPAE